MDKNTKEIQKTVIIISVLVLVSCSLTNKKPIKVMEQGEQAEQEVPKVWRDTTILPDICGLYSINSRDILTGHALHYNMCKCLMDKVFNGNKTAEKWIARFVDNTGCNYWLGCISESNKLRGPIIFEAFLRQEPSYERLPSYDGLKTQGTTAQYCFGCILKMIKTIDGLEEYDYVSKRLPVIHSRWTSLTEYSDVELMTYDKAHMEILRDAWESGKIVLKDYGEGSVIQGHERY